MIFHRLRFRQAARQYQSCQREPTARIRTRDRRISIAVMNIYYCGRSALYLSFPKAYTYKFTYINKLFFMPYRCLFQKQLINIFVDYYL